MVLTRREKSFCVFKQVEFYFVEYVIKTSFEQNYGPVVVSPAQSWKQAAFVYMLGGKLEPSAADKAASVSRDIRARRCFVRRSR